MTGTHPSALEDTITDAASEMSVAADVADAIDPTLTDDQRAAAAHRACHADPALAITMATSLAQGLVSGLGEMHPEGAAGVMRNIRSQFSNMPTLGSDHA